MDEKTDAVGAPDHRWRSHRFAGGVVRVAVYTVPLAMSILASMVAARFVPRPGGWWSLAWWAGVLAASSVTLVVTERFARRFLPLSMLLQLSLVFPDNAPSRFAVAMRSGTTTQLRAHVERLSGGHRLSAVEAAEAALTLLGNLTVHHRHTRGHSERVRALSDLVADQLKVRGSDRDLLQWSALLHDVGKLSVTTEVLDKPGRPDARQWEMIRRHPEEGARLTLPLQSWLGEWASAIDGHHERFDGSGYPGGLAGEASPWALASWP